MKRDGGCLRAALLVFGFLASAEVAGPKADDQDLLRAARLNDPVLIRKILDRSGQDLSDRDGQDLTALHWAALRGTVSILAMLLEAGADIASAGGAYGRTAVHLVSCQGYHEAIPLLIAKGAYVNVRDRTGLTPLHLAARRGSVPSIGLLIDAGAVVTARDKLGLTPLHWACHQGIEEAARLLLERGASAAATDDFG